MWLPLYATYRPLPADTDGPKVLQRTVSLYSNSSIDSPTTPFAKERSRSRGSARGSAESAMWHVGWIGGRGGGGAVEEEGEEEEEENGGLKINGLN